MHHDKKVSLALGILFVGVIGALFFRHETGASEDPVPRLHDPKSLDDRIAEKPVRPYQAPQSQTEKPETADYGFSFDGFSDHSSGGEPADVSNDTHAAIEPIRATSADAPDVPPQPDQNAAWDVVPGSENVRLSNHPPRAADRSPRAARASGSQRAETPRMRKYRVKSGDTLTGLAARFLGNSRRYGEILRVNRDRLKSPRDLRAGMILLIPGPTADERSPSQRSSAKPAQQPAATTSASKAPPRKAGNAPLANDRRFRPVRRPPFILRTRETYTPPVIRADSGRPRSYVIQRGDSLDRIARRFYGTPRAIPAIVRANGDRLAHPNLLRPGMTIVLP